MFIPVARHTSHLKIRASLLYLAAAAPPVGAIDTAIVPFGAIDTNLARALLRVNQISQLSPVQGTNETTSKFFS